MKPAREPTSNHPKPSVSLKNALRILPVRRSFLTLVGRNRPWSEISFSLRNLPVRGFDSYALGFNTPLAYRRSSYPPPSSNLVHTHPDRALLRCTRLSTPHHLPKGTKSELGRGGHGECHAQPTTSPSRPNRPAESQRQPPRLITQN